MWTSSRSLPTSRACRVPRDLRGDAACGASARGRRRVRSAHGRSRSSRRQRPRPYRRYRSDRARPDRDRHRQSEHRIRRARGALAGRRISFEAVNTDALARLIERAQQRAQSRHTEQTRQSVQTNELGGMVGQTATMRSLFDSIRRVAPLEVCVLVHGESGTGKELVARSLHELSVARAASSRSTAVRSLPIFCRVSSSVTSAVRSRARCNRMRVTSSRPKAARCSSTKSPKCRSRRRCSCCACSKRARSRASAARAKSRSTCESSPVRTAIRRKPSRKARCARISTIDCSSSRLTCRRCASVARTSSRSRSTSSIGSTSVIARGARSRRARCVSSSSGRGPETCASFATRCSASTSSRTKARSRC